MLGHQFKLYLTETHNLKHNCKVQHIDTYYMLSVTSSDHTDKYTHLTDFLFGISIFMWQNHHMEQNDIIVQIYWKFNLCI
jgi:hypothetical protein